MKSASMIGSVARSSVLQPRRPHYRICPLDVYATLPQQLHDGPWGADIPDFDMFFL